MPLTQPGCRKANRGSGAAHDHRPTAPRRVGLGGGGGSMRARRFAAIPSSRALRYMRWQQCYIQHRVYAQSSV